MNISVRIYTPQLNDSGPGTGALPNTEASRNLGRMLHVYIGQTLYVIQEAGCITRLYDN